MNVQKIILNIIIATGIGIALLFALPNVPIWAALLAGLFVFTISILTQDIISRLKNQNKVMASIKLLKKSQSSMLAELEALQESQPGRFIANADESDPESMSQAVMSELKFMRSLFDQITEYHEHIVANQNTASVKQDNVQKADQDSTQPFIEEVEGTKVLSREDLLEALQAALKSDRIEMLLQPIVSLPQRKRRHVECFSRIKDLAGPIIVPDNYIKIAQDESLISIIDNTLIFRCVQLLRKALKKSHAMNFFCNISTYSLKREKFVSGVIEFFKSNPRLSRHIIFEIDYYNLREDMTEVMPTIEKLAKKNCYFSLDKIENLTELDVTHLKKCNFKFIKVEAKFLQNLIATDEGLKVFKTFKKKTDKADIDIILTKVEEESQLIDVLDLNFDFGQGYLFGAPKLSSY